MQRLTIFKAATAFSLAFLAPMAAGIQAAQTGKDWATLFIGGLISGLTALRSFFDQSYSRDPNSADVK